MCTLNRGVIEKKNVSIKQTSFHSMASVPCSEVKIFTSVLKLNRDLAQQKQTLSYHRKMSHSHIVVQHYHAAEERRSCDTKGASVLCRNFY